MLGAGLAGAAVAAVFAPSLFWLLLVAAAALTGVVLAFRHTVGATALWLLVTGCTLEMCLGDLLSPGAYQPIIAMVKAGGMGLAGLAVLRFGGRADLFNPGLAFLAMFIAGWAHGLHPGLTTADSLRSLAGSIAPFVFSFSRLSRDWARAIIRMTAWTPLISVGIGAALAIAGIRPLFVESGGERLAALGHPAFLAGFALAAIYACLIELYREGDRGHLLLLGANLVILVLTGARAPMLYGVVVIGLTLAFLPSPAVSGRLRWGLLLAAAACVPVLAGLADSLSALRLFNVVAHDAGDLSGRDELWPLFEHAAAQSPWFGWGIGAGNTIIPQSSDIVRYMHTWAAHNEYLRIAVEGGQLGRALLITSFVLWCAGNSRWLPRTDRVIIRLAFIAFACHAFTDNVLISTSASVLFAFVAAVFARGRLEAEQATLGRRRSASIAELSRPQPAT
ncbi:MAG TPA: O-antigen ligase family protein [Acetobacteraceae bacterium]|nr:O-antigen ligase family protein [Acetobacteraceae bacterium]